MNIIITEWERIVVLPNRHRRDKICLTGKNTEYPFLKITNETHYEI